MDWSRLTLGIGAAAAFAVGAFRVATTDGSVDGYALLAVSLILVGVSLTLELHERWHKDRRG